MVEGSWEHTPVLSSHQLTCREPPPGMALLKPPGRPSLPLAVFTYATVPVGPRTAPPSSGHVGWVAFISQGQGTYFLAQHQLFNLKPMSPTQAFPRRKRSKTT